MSNGLRNCITNGISNVINNGIRNGKRNGIGKDVCWDMRAKVQEMVNSNI